MKKFFLLIILVSSAVVCATGQSFRYGLSVYNFQTFDPYSKQSFLPKFQYGFNFKPADISGSVLLKVGLNIVGRGSKHHYNRTFTTTTNGTTYNTTIDNQYKLSFTYLENPFICSFPVVSDKLFIELGPSYSLLLSSKRKGETDYTVATSSQKYIEDVKFSDKDAFPEGSSAKRPVSKYDFAINFGVNAMLTNRLGLNLRYYHGLIDVFKNNYPYEKASQANEYHRGVQLAIELNLAD